jgi:hypothetical protein
LGGAAGGPGQRRPTRALWGTLPVLYKGVNHERDAMKSNGIFQKQATVTDQKTRTNDEHVLELDKQHLKESMDEPNLIPKKGGKHQPAKEE